MKRGEFPISGRLRNVLEAYPEDTSRKELLTLLDALVQFLSIDTSILASLNPGTLENLFVQLPQFERLPLSVREPLQEEIRELEQLLPVDSGLALTRALDNYLAVKEEYEFTSKKLGE